MPAAIAPVLVGTSGYAYPAWRPSFYPADLPDRGMLAFYAGRFPAVELNHTFYRVPTPAAAAGWREQVPAEFRFAVKANPRFCALRRIADGEVRLSGLFEPLAPLGATLGCVFYQVPKATPADAGLVRDFLAAQPRGVRIALEAPRPDWATKDVEAALVAGGATRVAVDADDGPEPVLCGDAEWIYLRLRRASYADPALAKWRERARSFAGGGFVFFRHEDTGSGPAFAARWLADAGVSATRRRARPRP